LSSGSRRLYGLRAGSPPPGGEKAERNLPPVPSGLLRRAVSTALASLSAKTYSFLVKKRETKRTGERVPPRALGFAVLSGILTALPFFPVPRPLHGLILVSLVPLLAATAGKGFRRGALYGFITGFTGCGIAFHWILPLIPNFSALPYPLGVLGFLGWLVWASLFWAVMGGVWGMRLPAGLRGTAVVLSPLLLEYLWPRIFRWHFGDPLVELPALAQIADLGGVWAATLLVLTVNYAVWRIVDSRARGTRFPAVSSVLAGVLLAASLLYGAVRLKRAPDSSGELTVGLVHTAIPLEEKHRAFRDGILYTRHLRALRDQAIRGTAEKGPVDLVVFPEAMVNVPWGSERIGFSRAIGVPVLFGAGVFSVAPPRQYNSAVLETEDSLEVYHKRHLMLFGEYVPLSDTFPGIEDFLGIHSLARGKGPRLFSLDGHRLAPLICYEVILPEYVRKFTAKGAVLLVNVTEDGWYGWTGEPYQHLLLARWRAIENRRFLLRCVNNGLSAVVDPAGRIAAGPRDPRRPDFIRARIRYYRGKTLYTVYGDWLVAVAALVLSISAAGHLFLRLRIGVRSGEEELVGK